MATEVLKSFGNLQQELEQAKSSLKGVDENIKRLIGRDPSDLPPRPGLKRPLVNDDKSRSVSKPVKRNFENDEPAPRRRNTSSTSVFKRLSDKPIHEDQHGHGQARQMISKVIVTPKEVPSRQEALDAQSKDEKSKARNRRMFGALLGTLQKFQQEETKLKKKEDKRAQLEKKIEEHEIKEKQEIKKERQELFLNRRKKQAEIKMIELKMLRMKEYAIWEEQQRPRTNFILTKAKPQIHFLPRKLNDVAKELLEKSKAEVEQFIEAKRQSVCGELKHIEERMKRNFDHKFGYKESHKEDHKDDALDTQDPDDIDNNQFDIDGDTIMAEIPSDAITDTKVEDSGTLEPTDSTCLRTEENLTTEEEPEVLPENVLDESVSTADIEVNGGNLQYPQSGVCEFVNSNLITIIEGVPIDSLDTKSNLESNI